MREFFRDLWEAITTPPGQVYLEMQRERIKTMEYVWRQQRRAEMRATPPQKMEADDLYGRRYMIAANIGIEEAA